MICADQAQGCSFLSQTLLNFPLLIYPTTGGARRGSSYKLLFCLLLITRCCSIWVCVRRVGKLNSLVLESYVGEVACVIMQCYECGLMDSYTVTTQWTRAGDPHPHASTEGVQSLDIVVNQLL